MVWRGTEFQNGKHASVVGLDIGLMKGADHLPSPFSVNMICRSLRNVIDRDG